MSIKKNYEKKFQLRLLIKDKRNTEYVLCISFFFFLLRILSIFNTHTEGEGRRFFKETYSSV